MKTLLMLAAIISTASTSFGALITSASSSNSAVMTVTLGATTKDDTGFPTGTAVLNVVINQKHVPAQINFGLATENIGGLTGRNYTITMNITNNLPTGASRDYVSGIDIDGFGVPGATGPFTAGLDNFTPIPNGPGQVVNLGLEPDPVDGLGFNIPNGFRWGGLNGGGPAIYNGGTATITFNYNIAQSVSGVTPFTGASSVNFTANPEPGTMVLAGMALLPLGVVVRRRRKAAIVKAQDVSQA